MASRAQLRRAVLGDESGIAGLVTEGFAGYVEFAPAGWTPIVEPPDKARTSLEDPTAWGMVAEEDGEMVGVAFWTVAANEPDMAHLRYLFVRPSHWGTGLAAELHARALAAARERGWPRIRLITPAGQARARRFYEREGWRAASEPFLEPLIGFDVVEYRRDL